MGARDAPKTGAPLGKRDQLLGKDPGAMASGKPPGTFDYTPNIFIHENHYDRELTPRKGWQQQVSHLNSLLDQDKERYRQLEMKSFEEKQALEKQIVELHSKFVEEQQRVKTLESQAVQEHKLKEEYQK